MRRSLTKQERLGRGPELTRLFSEGRKTSAPGLRLVMRPSGLGRSRIAVVNARGYTRAVDRNRDRRIAREAWRTVKHTLPAGRDYAIVLYPGSWGRADRRARIDGLLRRAGSGSSSGRIDG